MKKFALILSVILLTVSMNLSVAYAAPSGCANCGQNNFLMMSCGSFSRWKQTSAACPNNYLCTKRTSLYTTVYTCPNCDWQTVSGTHDHMTEHTECADEYHCPYSDEYFIYRIPHYLK